LKGRVLRLIDYLRKFENSDGLLERLPSWVFIEWSAANNYVQDVNYPSNMLYAGVLSAAAKLYGLPDLEAKAEKTRATIRGQSFDGTFFVDNAVRKEGKLGVTRNRTEVCQYFAFFFRVAGVETHAGLWAALKDKFGPKRQRENPFPDVGMANSFIGNMLRIELLSKQGLSQQILDESIDYLLYMAERTGTLWENVGDYASCNHGFASHIIHTLYRDVLGVRELDRVGKKLRLRFSPLKLEWCEGAMPTPQGNVSISWRKKGNVIEYALSVPDGYVTEIENSSGLELRKVN
jgi:alpha-L-rhamnosidase